MVLMRFGLMFIILLSFEKNQSAVYVAFPDSKIILENLILMMLLRIDKLGQVVFWVGGIKHFLLVMFFTPTLTLRP